MARSMSRQSLRYYRSTWVSVLCSGPHIYVGGSLPPFGKKIVG